jgi:hypothetical protein
LAALNLQLLRAQTLTNYFTIEVVLVVLDDALQVSEDASLLINMTLVRSSVHYVPLMGPSFPFLRFLSLRGIVVFCEDTARLPISKILIRGFNGLRCIFFHLEDHH